MSHFLNEPFSLRLLSPEDLGSICALRDHVLSALPDPDMYVREENESAFLKRNMNAKENGQTVGIFSGRSLIAYGMVSYPGVDEYHNIGRLIPLPVELLTTCAVMESAMVHPDYRCFGWQSFLLRIRERLAEDRGRRIYTAIASPINAISRHNLLKAGYQIIGYAELEGQLRRHIFVRGFRRQHISSQSAGEPVAVDSLNFSAQKALFDGGFVGTRDLHNGRLLFEMLI